MFRISKLYNFKENLKIKYELINNENNVEFCPASGVHLNPIEEFNQDWQIHIETENSELMNSTA